MLMLGQDKLHKCYANDSRENRFNSTSYPESDDASQCFSVDSVPFKGHCCYSSPNIESYSEIVNHAILYL